MAKKLTLPEIMQMKSQGKKITMMTAYDYTTAMLVEKAGIDTILVGDSLGMTVLGYDSTVFVTMEEMLHHTRAVKRGAKNTFIIVTCPSVPIMLLLHKQWKMQAAWYRRQVRMLKLEGAWLQRKLQLPL